MFSPLAANFYLAFDYESARQPVVPAPLFGIYYHPQKAETQTKERERVPNQMPQHNRTVSQDFAIGAQDPESNQPLSDALSVPHTHINPIPQHKTKSRQIAEIDDPVG